MREVLTSEAQFGRQEFNGHGDGSGLIRVLLGSWIVAVNREGDDLKSVSL